MIVDEQMRYDRIIIVLTPALILMQYLIYFALRPWRPRLTENAAKAWAGKEAVEKMRKSGRDAMAAMDARAWRKFHKETACTIFCCVFHTVYATAAIAAVNEYGSGEALTPARVLGDRSVLLAAGDLEYLRTTEAAGFLGSVFGAVMICFLYFWFLGWDLYDKPAFFHHITFLGVTLILARRLAMPYSGLVAMSMEGSSPALNLMMLLRQLGSSGAQTATVAAFAVFSISFIYLRVWAFGKAVVQVIVLRMSRPETFPVHVPAWESDVVVLLWTAGWVLQLYWASQILKKARRQLLKK